MPRHVQHQTEGTHRTESSVNQNDIATTETPLTAERLLRLAEVVASGAAPFPTSIGATELPLLLSGVRRIRHERLVAMIARAIAQDIRASEAESRD